MAAQHDAMVLPQSVWPHEKSDLPLDSKMVFGRLDNGFRYVLMQNQNPKDRVSMHLNIQAGSANETDSQQGLAHFLEHMLFNGSEHFKPGELVKYFQSIGMQFGADANAHTGFFETVYDIFLPDGHEES
ncbi:MAG: insulinase family protein, partial [Deltaproteobacteria bacterium]|nr:insulinase family protein [Deltaproteobacteria bacterium]